MTFDLTANSARRVPGKFMAAIEEVIMENSETAKGENTYPASWQCSANWWHDTDMGVPPCNMFLWFQID